MNKFSTFLLLCIFAPTLSAAASETARLEHLGDYLFYDAFREVRTSPNGSALAVLYVDGLSTPSTEIIDLPASELAGAVRHALIGAGEPQWINETTFCAVSNGQNKRALWRVKTTPDALACEKISDDPSTATLAKYWDPKGPDLLELRGAAQTNAPLLVGFPEQPAPKKTAPPPQIPHAVPQTFGDIRIFDNFGHEWKPGDTLLQFPDSANVGSDASRGLTIERGGAKKELVAYEPMSIVRDKAGELQRVKYERGLVEEFACDKSTQRLLINYSILFDAETGRLAALNTGGQDEIPLYGAPRSYFRYKYALLPGRELLLRRYVHSSGGIDGEDDRVCKFQVVNAAGEIFGEFPGVFGERKGIIHSGELVLCSKNYVVIRAFGHEDKPLRYYEGLRIYAIRPSL